MFGCSYDGDGSPSSTGNVQSVEGLSGSIVSGLAFDYMYQQSPDNYVDEISAAEGTLLFESQDGNGRVVCWEGSADDYRAIHSSFIFGALRDGGSTKQELMSVYMDYLTYQTATSPHGETPPAADIEISVPNPGYGCVPVTVRTGEDSHLSINIYDLSGRRIETLFEGPVNPGEHRFVWEASAAPAGSYLIEVRAKHETVAKKSVLIH